MHSSTQKEGAQHKARAGQLFVFNSLPHPFRLGGQQSPVGPQAGLNAGIKPPYSR